MHLKGDAAGGRAIQIEDDDATADQIAANARAGLARLITAYDDPTMPYLARLRVVLERVEGDYDHLARIKEWSSGDDNDW